MPICAGSRPNALCDDRHLAVAARPLTSLRVGIVVERVMFDERTGVGRPWLARSLVNSTYTKYRALEAERERRMQAQRAARLALLHAGAPPLSDGGEIARKARMPAKWTETIE